MWPVKKQPKFRRNISPPSSELKSKLSKKQTVTAGEEIIGTKIPVNRLARRLEGNIAAG
jgi:hypothetical protein